MDDKEIPIGEIADVLGALADEARREAEAYPQSTVRPVGGILQHVAARIPAAAIRRWVEGRIAKWTQE